MVISVHVMCQVVEF